MAVKGLVVVGGLAAVGLFLATRKQTSPVAVETPHDPPPDDPLPPSSGQGGGATDSENPGSGSLDPGGPGGPPSGSGEPTSPPATPDDSWVANHMDSLPASLQALNLSGNEVFEYTGETQIADSNSNTGFRPFMTWTVHHSLNDFPIDIYVQKDSPWNWIAVLVEPATQNHPEHLIVLYIQGATQIDRDFLGGNIAGLPPGKFQSNFLNT